MSRLTEHRFVKSCPLYLYPAALAQNQRCLAVDPLVVPHLVILILPGDLPEVPSGCSGLSGSPSPRPSYWHVRLVRNDRTMGLAEISSSLARAIARLSLRHSTWAIAVALDDFALRAVLVLVLVQAAS
jgi:hypothetical protein